MVLDDEATVWIAVLTLVLILFKDFVRLLENVSITFSLEFIMVGFILKANVLLSSNVSASSAETVVSLSLDLILDFGCSVPKPSVPLTVVVFLLVSSCLVLNLRAFILFTVFLLLDLLP